jgi:hypothetical protein
MCSVPLLQRSIRAILYLLAGLAVLLASACRSDPPPRETARVTHPNGLVLVPTKESFAAEQTGQGWIFRPENWRKVTHPKEIRIELRSALPPGNFPSSKTLNGATIHYRIDAHSAGAGPAERVLEAWKQAGPRWIWLSESLRSDNNSESVFDDGWSLLDQASFGGA